MGYQHRYKCPTINKTKFIFFLFYSSFVLSQEHENTLEFRAIRPTGAIGAIRPIRTKNISIILDFLYDKCLLENNTFFHIKEEINFMVQKSNQILKPSLNINLVLNEKIEQIDITEKFLVNFCTPLNPPISVPL